MKRTTRNLLALLLAAIMVLCLIPTAAIAESRIKDIRDSKRPPAAPDGYIRSPEHGTHVVSDAYRKGDMEAYYHLTGIQPKRDTLPSTYDSRNENIVTSVKNQNPYGSCWAHAAMACVESYMIKYGVPVGTGAAATTSLNLSETQHCFFNYSSAYDAEGMLTGDKCTLTGSDGCLDAGGNGEMSAYTLQHWTGAASESTAALAYSKASTVARSGLDSQYAYQYNVSHVQNSEWIPATDIEGVKRAIMKYGAGNISYYAGNSTPTYNCTIDTSSQESSSHKWANHAITLIGWDDTIAASRFSPNTPSGNGGWLCKNSWGTGYFNQGYMYISYEDTSVLEGYIYFYDAEPIDNYDHNYQYDGSCNVVCYGKGWPSSEDYYVGFADNTKVANVFTAKGSELLEAVALCNWDEALSYTVEIYKNPTTGNPSSGTLMTSQSGTLTYSGYYTIPLDQPVMLAAGDTFSVVFTQSVPVADENGYYVHTPYDATFSNTNVVSWAKWTHANHGNTSYYKEPNGNWTDCPDNGDYRIKAFTSDVNYTVTAESNNEAWGTVTVVGTKITATPAAGYYVSGYEVINGTATATINGNVISVAPESDCTIKVIFAPKPSYTVNFVAAGNAEGSQTAYIYDEITLPASVSANPEGWTFIGWAEAALEEETLEKPAFYAPGASYTVASNTTLYAVYSRVEEGTGAPVYELVTSKPDDWSGKYVVTYLKTTGMYVMKGVTPGSNGAQIESASNASTYAASGVTLDGTTLSNVANDYVFTVAPHGSYYSIQSAATGTYVGMDSSSYLAGFTTYTSSNCDWTPGTQTDVTSATNAKNGSYPLLSFSTGNSYFWSGSSGTAAAKSVYWWKERSGSSTYYTTNPVTETHTHTLTHVPAVEPTCTEEGNSEYWTCSECGKCFADAEGTNEITQSNTVIAALGHDYHAVVTAPTCTEQGYTTHTCSRCGDSYVDAYVDALGHSYGEWTSNNDGTHSHVCSVCGDSVHENCTYTDTVVAPTETEQGYTTHTCSVCGYTFTDSYTDPVGRTFTVGFSVPAGVTAPADMTCPEGESITLPAADAPAGYTFLGWVTEDVDNALTQPEAILTGTYAATASIVLKALYSRTVSTASGYQLVTGEPETWEGNYVITYGKTDAAYVLKGIAGTKKYESKSAGGAAALADTNMTVEGELLTGATDAYIFRIEASGEKFTVRSAATGTYLANKGGYLYSYKTDTASYCRWSFAINEGTVDATNAASRTCSHLSFSPKNYFMVNRTANAEICFWKQSGTTESKVYTTVID